MVSSPACYVHGERYCNNTAYNDIPIILQHNTYAHRVRNMHNISLFHVVRHKVIASTRRPDNPVRQTSTSYYYINYVYTIVSKNPTCTPRRVPDERILHSAIGYYRAVRIRVQWMIQTHNISNTLCFDTLTIDYKNCINIFFFFLKYMSRNIKGHWL